MGDLDLNGTTIRNCGESNGDDNDVVTVKYIKNWINKWFPVQIIGWFQENARVCYYFRTVDDFIHDKKKNITGFKSQSKYYPVYARLDAGSLTSEELPTKRLCAVLPGSTCLSVIGASISKADLYVTIVITVKFTGARQAASQVYTDNWLALTAEGDKFNLYGVTGKRELIAPRGLDKWNTVWIEWGYN